MQTCVRAVLVLLGILTVSWPGSSHACAPAPRAGEPVQIAGEEAVIIWDGTTRTESFIRRASFTTPARDFGFLVPTPTQPVLAEAPDALFQNLARVTRPRVEVRKSLGPVPFSCLAAPFLVMKLAAPSGVAPPVRVLDFQRVAGYDAVVLEADSASALGEWLKAHGYEFRPALVEWLKPYIIARWKLTAFKIAQQSESASGSVSTAAVRMTFQTDRPLFPYREPADQRIGQAGPRLLRLFLVSDTRMEGRIGDGTPWPGEVSYSDRQLDMASLLSWALPAGASPPGAWLTKFEDKSSPRPGTDELFFSPAAAATPFLPPPTIEFDDTPVPIPIEPLLLGAWLLWRRRRRRAAQL